MRVRAVQHGERGWSGDKGQPRSDVADGQQHDKQRRLGRASPRRSEGPQRLLPSVRERSDYFRL